jgi:hypothetical protein
VTPSSRADFERLTSEICERRGWKWDGHRVELELDGGRRQQVEVDYFAHAEHEMVRLFSPIGPTLRIKPDRLVFALEMTFKLAHGSMAVHDGMLVVVDTRMLSELDTGEIESAIFYIADTADHYEHSMFGPDAY